MAVRRVIALLAVVAAPAAAADAEMASLGPNPIRKVTRVLEKMVKKINTEGQTEEKLYEKFMCHCKTEKDSLKKSIADREKRFPNLEADLKAAQQQKVQTEAQVAQAKADRVAAEKAIADGSALRDKESKAFAKDSAEQAATIAAVGKAVTALTNGVGAKANSFLQSGEAHTLRELALNAENMEDSAREELLAFLESSSGYEPQSGEIIGILKTMGEQMQGDLAKAKAQEAAALKAFQSMTDAKAKEIKALTTAIESKTQRVGELAVSIVQIKNDMGDGARILAEDKKFYADLEKNCDTKTVEYQERVKQRNDELTALSDTIKLLTSDDALDLFKKTLNKKPKTSFLQVTAVSELKQKALAELNRHKQNDKYMAGRLQLDFLALALQGKQVGFEKVVKMIDEMVVNLKEEQVADDKKKEYCIKEIQKAIDKSKGLTRGVSDEDTAIETGTNSVGSINKSIRKLQKNILKLDKDVVTATEQRKAENAEVLELVASNRAAMDLLKVAKQRLNKFYNPNLAKLAAKAPQAFVQEDQAPAPAAAETTPRPGRATAPETFKGPLAKKSEESNGVIGLLDTIIHDLDKENVEAEANEKASQKAYEQFLKDSSDKRRLDLEAITQKSSEKASAEGSLTDHKGVRGTKVQELAASKKLEASIHAGCDSLIKDFDMFKEARVSEIESLQRAKSTLFGAKFSFGQIKAHGFLAKK